MPSLDRTRWQAVSPYLDKALEMRREDLAEWLMLLHVEQPEIAADLEMLLDDRDALAATDFLQDDVAGPMMAGLEPERDSHVALSSGTRLGTYEIVALLGAGGMGEVYRAKDLRLGREIALKVLPARMATDAGRLARF